MPTMFQRARFTRAESGKTTRKSSIFKLSVVSCQLSALATDSFLHSFEQVRFKFCVVRIARGGEVEHFLRRHAAEILSQPREQRRLRLVLHEGLNLALESLCSDFNARSDRGWRSRHAM